MRKIFNSFLELFFPPFCISCNRRLSETERHICFDCLMMIPVTNHLDIKDNNLEQQFAGRFPFRRMAAYAYFIQESTLQKIVHELKYRNNPDIGYYMGEIIGKWVGESGEFHSVDFIIPIPLHKKRLKSRGYNQSEVLAQKIGEYLEKPILVDCLIRTINNPSQTKLSKKERYKNIQNIFEITNKNGLANKHILLIDDVITTGATIETCAKLILTCPNTSISVLSIGCNI